jgi:hypothetical protein
MKEVKLARKTHAANEEGIIVICFMLLVQNLIVEHVLIREHHEVQIEVRARIHVGMLEFQCVEQ